MLRPFNILIVENQSLIIDTFKKALELINNSFDNLDFKVTSSINCMSALAEVQNRPANNPIDLLLLNINIPPKHLEKTIFADDIAIALRKRFCETKIIVFTSNYNNYRIDNIIKTINPEGFLVNTDINFKELVYAIKTILVEPPYYSKSIISFLRKRMSNDFAIDNIDRIILYHLSSGTKMKDLSKLVCLSLSAIERRKRMLRDIFNIDKKNTQALIHVAREKGII